MFSFFSKWLNLKNLSAKNRQKRTSPFTFLDTGIWQILPQFFFKKTTKTIKKSQKPHLLFLEDRLVPTLPYSPMFPLPISINTTSGTSGQITSASATFNVTFNSPVTGIDSSDFKIITSGSVANGNITSVTGSGTSYAVTVTGITGSGTLGLNLNPLADISEVTSYQTAIQNSTGAGSQPRSIVSGDINNDGKLDMISANIGGDSISIFLGNGNGSFGTKTDISTGAGTDPRFITLADVNNDGKQDLAVAFGGSGTGTGVYLGNGDGTFGNKNQNLAGSNIFMVQVGDINKDGKLDLVTANFSGQNVNVLLGNGNGTFASPVTTLTTSRNPRSVSISDVNNDGNLDILVSGTDFTNTTFDQFLGNGNGTFASGTSFSVSGNSQFFKTGDVNLDGKLDIVGVCLSSNPDNGYVKLGNGDGTYSSSMNFTASSGPFSVDIGDLNGDGKPDIVTAAYYSGRATVLLGNGNGSFGPYIDQVTGSGTIQAVMGDINNDGRLDLMAANFGSNNISVLLANGTSASTLKFYESANILTGASSNSTASGDFNNDGIPDLAVTIYSGNVKILLSNGNGTFLNAPEITGLGNCANITVGDVNNDGQQDLAIGTMDGSNKVSVLLGNGNGTFQAVKIFNSGVLTTAIGLSDVNLDGKLDLIQTVFFQPIAQISLGNGDGTFATPAQLSLSGNPETFAINDINLDGKPDILVSENGGNYVEIFLGNGNGTFQTSYTSGSISRPFVILVGDVNNDGKPDMALILKDINPSKALIMLGNGDGTFQQLTPFGTLSNPKNGQLADFNGDGNLDLLSSGEDNNIQLFLGNGDGTFKAQINFQPSGNVPVISGLIAQDFNNDGRVDIAALNRFTQTGQSTPVLSILMNSIGLTGQSYNIISTPDAPTNLNATTGNGTITISFTAGSNGGATITNYEYSTDGGNSFTAFSPADTTSPVTINGLVNGTTYQIQLRAVNSQGAGAASSTLSVLLPTAPAAPFNLQATPANGSASISFTAGSNGGSSITNYEFSINGGTSFTAFSPAQTSSPVTINGLTNGTTYQVQLRAVNSQGAGTASSSVNVTPATTPSAPTNLQATPGNGSTSISFTSGFNGGASVTNYEYSINGGSSYTAFSPAQTSSPVSITGLTNGTNYQIKLRAVNSQGSGTASSSISVIPYGAPTQLSVSTNASGAASGSAFTTQPVITILDSTGATVLNSTASVTMSVNLNGTTVGTTTVNAVNGVATFNGVGMSGTAGTQYTLTFASNALISATQNITPTYGIASKLAVVTAASGAVNDAAFTTQPVIAVQDSFGNTVANSNASVSLTVSPQGASLIGITTSNAVNGVVNFNNAGLKGLVGSYSIQYSSGVLQSAQNSVQLTYGQATKLSLTIPAAGAINNLPFDVQPILLVQDSSGNTVTNSSVVVTLSSNNGSTVVGNSTATAVNGVVTFSGAGLKGLPLTPYTLTYGSGNLITQSQNITVTTAPAPLVTGSAPIVGFVPSEPGSAVNLYDAVTGEPNGVAIPFPNFMGEIRVSAGDFNLDGKSETVAAAGPGGGPAVTILDSQTGEIRATFFAYDPAFTGGVFVAVKDVNNDGVADIITGAGSGGGPHVKVFNGTNLQPMASFFAYAETFTGGVSVATADINQDGILDIVTGAGPGGGPHVKVFDGANNNLISEWFAYPMDFTGGVFVGMGDIGNDGQFEVVTGAGQGGGPVTAVWNPFTGQLLSQFFAYAQSFTGGVRVGVSDATGDGVYDLITGAGPSGGPHVKAFNYPNLDLLFEFFSGPESNKQGVFVS